MRLGRGPAAERLLEPHAGAHGYNRDDVRSLPPLIRWNRSSAVLLSAFFLVVLLIAYVWWPLAEEAFSYVDWQGSWWLYMDWLLIGIFLFMSVTIVARADLRTDGLILFVAAVGGLVIEAWGTQTNLWSYYTNERPPLWIVPAWPIATLCIDRITRVLDFAVTRLTRGSGAIQWGAAAKKRRGAVVKALYWMVFGGFVAVMLPFIWPTMHTSATILATLLCVVLIATPTDHRRALLVFGAGFGLGYFLELWGTTRECWTYYTYQTPPLFAVLAHGMAAVAFWRAGRWLSFIAQSALSLLRPARRRVGSRGALQ
jgi:hypothetical protein